MTREALEQSATAGADRLLLAGALRLDSRSWTRSAAARSTCSRSTRPTASPSGATTSGPTTCGCRGAIERLGRPTVMACTATATEEVAAEIIARGSACATRSWSAPASTGPTSPSTSSPLEGKGSKARKLALLEHGLADEANRPAIVYCGTRSDTDELAGDAARVGAARGRLPRGHGARRARLGPAPLHGRRRRRDRRHQRLRHGGRQGQRALGLALGDPDERRGLLPGGRPRGARRRARAGACCSPAAPTSAASSASSSAREIEPREVVAYVERLGAEAGPDGELDDRQPARRGGPDPARDRRARGRPERRARARRAPARSPSTGPRARDRVGRSAGSRRDRGWRAYRAVEAFGFSERCRRRALLDHFGDSTAPARRRALLRRLRPRGRAARPRDDPDPRPRASAAPRPPSRSTSRPRTSPFRALREWRLGAADGKPPTRSPTTRRCATIAARRPAIAVGARGHPRHRPAVPHPPRRRPARRPRRARLRLRAYRLTAGRGPD